MNEENNNQQPSLNISEDKFRVDISRDDLNTFFKFISRVDLKGQEVPEFNKLLSIFMPQNLKKAN